MASFVVFLYKKILRFFHAASFDCSLKFVAI